MFCKKCGAPINEKSRFCESCGAPTDELNNNPAAAKSLFGDKEGAFYKNIGLFFVAAGMLIVEAVMFYLPMLKVDVIIYDGSYSISDFWSMADSNIGNFFTLITAILFAFALVEFILMLASEKFRKSSAFLIPVAASAVSFCIYAFTALCLSDTDSLGIIESAILDEITDLLPAAVIYPVASFAAFILCVILISRISREEKAKADDIREQCNRYQLYLYVQQLENAKHNTAGNSDFSNLQNKTDTNNDNAVTTY